MNSKRTIGIAMIGIPAGYGLIWMFINYPLDLLRIGGGILLILAIIAYLMIALWLLIDTKESTDDR